MGTYSTWDFYEQFGGWPDPDEAVPSLDAIDDERKRRREEGDDRVIPGDDADRI